MLLSSVVSGIDTRFIRCLTTSALHVSATISELHRHHVRSKNRHTPQWLSLPAASRGPVLSKCQGPYGEIVVRCSSSSSSGSSSNSSSSESAGNASKPRIVLIGWLGAQERHFQKYVSMWDELGYDTLWIRPPTASIAVPRLGDRSAAEFARQLHNSARPDQKTVIHLFSNAGFIFFGTLLQQLASSQGTAAERSQETYGQAINQLSRGSLQPSLSSVLSSIQGVIIDSAPSRITPDIAARGLSSAILGIPADIVEGKYPRAMAFIRSMAHPYLNLPSIADRQRDVWATWQSIAPLCPQLYLHSTVDALVSEPEVSAFQKVQAARGVYIHKKLWVDSPHCEHFRYHPDEYLAALRTFMASLTHDS